MSTGNNNDMTDASKAIKSATLRKPLTPTYDPRDPISAISFLIKMSRNFEEQENYLEAVKCTESALLLRKKNHDLIQAAMETDPGLQEAQLPVSITDQANELVTLCNTYGVCEFNAKHFDSASFFLSKALFLTDNAVEKTPGDLNYSVKKMSALSGVEKSDRERMPQEEEIATLCFVNDDANRLRLRAATYNNFGCMEKRRNLLPEALDYFKKAAQIEVRMDANSMGSPSTYLNMCTVLNEMKRHSEAVSAVERAIASLTVALPAQTNEADLSNTAMMLAVGQYNLGVSLEKRGKAGDAKAAEKAYQLSLDTSRRYLLGARCPTVSAAIAAIKRMKVPRLAADAARPTVEPNVAVEEAVTAAAAPPAPAGGESRTGSEEPPVIGGPSGQQQQQQANGEAIFSLANSPAVGRSGGSSQLCIAVPQQQQQQQVSATPGTPQSYELAPPPSLVTPPSGTPASQFIRPSPLVPPTHPASPTIADQLNEKDPLSPLHGTLVVPSSQGLVCLPHPPSMAKKSTHDAAEEQYQQLLKEEQRGEEEVSTLVSSKDLLRPARAEGAPPPPPLLDPIEQPAGVQPVSSPPLRDMPHLSSFSAGSLASEKPTPKKSSQLSKEDQEMRQSIMEISRSLHNTSSTSRSKRKGGAGGSSTSDSNVRGILGRRSFGSQSGMSAKDANSAVRKTSISSKSASLEAQKQEIISRNRLRERSQAMARREKEKQLAEYDEQLAEQMCVNMVKGIREDQMRRCHQAAVTIQRLWRGVLARTYIRTLIRAVGVLQRVIRKFLVKARVRRVEMEELKQAAEAEQQRKELAAVRFLQAKIRQFIRRLNIRRDFLARQKRNFYAARTIQRAYRSFCERRAQLLLAAAEAHRREDEQQQFREKVAAQHIQRAYRSYKEMKKGREESLKIIQQHQAAVVIQAVVRGMLTRAWFVYYCSYRREQKLRSAESIQRITVIQAMYSAAVSQRHCLEQHANLVGKIRDRHLNMVATKIQCQWRKYVAGIHFDRLQAEQEMRHRAATRIQRWYQTRVLRGRFKEHREQKRRAAAAAEIQSWVRGVWQQRKEKAFALYHNELLRKQRLVRLQDTSIRLLQACCAAVASRQVVKVKQEAFDMKCSVAKVLQRVCRGFVDRKVVATDKVIAKRIEREELEHAIRVASARTIQRAWRVALAKDKVEQMRREHFAALIIYRSYRVYLAKKELGELKAHKQTQIEEKAARVIQRRVRAFLKRVKFSQIADYYKEQERKKRWRMRRAEAALMIQSVWRGHCTRGAVKREQAALAELSVYAVKIQRAWRRSKEKVKNDERASKRQGFVQAAIVIQCFWRKMSAAERVAKIRIHRQKLIEVSIRIQTWWRGHLAKRVLLHLKAVQEEEDRVAVIYAIKWEKAVTVINSFIRTRMDQQQSLGRVRKYLIGQLTDKQRADFVQRRTAATKIQATYRGFYERAVVRYLRREKQEKDRLAAEQAAKEHRMAIRIQCCFRRFCATKEMSVRLTAKRQAIFESQEKYIESANPHEVVRELFWVHNAINRREKALNVVATSDTTQKAAVVIQKAFKMFKARRDARIRKEEQKKEYAARVIQQYWRAHHRYVVARDKARRLAAALLIQSRARGWMVRRVWNEWKEACEEELREFVRQEDRRDEAGTSIQSEWRRIVAIRRAEVLRRQREETFLYNSQYEAAAIIQNAFRRHYRRAARKIAN